MTINALNSGANVWLADFEDANTPLWENMVTGQLNLKDALDRTIDFTSEDGKSYRLRPDDELATIVVRPRGWHLDEKHLLVDGAAGSPAACSTSRCTSSTAPGRQLDKGNGPYFYLPKMESHLEARLWNDAFNLAQDTLGLPRGTIRATVLIETIPAAFEMDEILYELRDHSAGLNAGRWDYLFSIIKKFRSRGRDFVLPERNSVTMTAPFMRAYTELLVKTCHRPRRARHGRDGRVHPQPARSGGERDRAGQGARRQDPRVGGRLRRLLGGAPGPGRALHGGLRRRARRPAQPAGPAARGRQRHRPPTCSRSPRPRASSPRPACATTSAWRLQYLATWLGGNGAVAIFNLMEDAATAEISRSQVWQWLHNDVALDDGPTGHPGPGRADHRRGTGDHPRPAQVRPSTPPATARRRRCSTRSRWPTTTPSSSPSRPTSACPDPRRITRGMVFGPGGRGKLEGNGTTRRGERMIRQLVPAMVDICGRDGGRDRSAGAAHLRVRRADLAPGRTRRWWCCRRRLSRSPRWSGCAPGPGCRSWPAASGTGLSGGALPRTDGRADRHLQDAPDHRHRPGQPAGHRRTGGHQSVGERGGTAVRLFLCPGSVQPADLLGGRERGGELRRRALPQERLHRASRHRAGDRHPGGRADLAGRRHRRGARL